MHSPSCAANLSTGSEHALGASDTEADVSTFAPPGVASKIEMFPCYEALSPVPSCKLHATHLIADS